MHLAFLALSPAGAQGCMKGWTFSVTHSCFVYSTNPRRLLHSFHDTWCVSPSPTLGWWNKLAESVDTISIRRNWARLIQSQQCTTHKKAKVYSCCTLTDGREIISEEIQLSTLWMGDKKFSGKRNRLHTSTVLARCPPKIHSNPHLGKIPWNS